MAKRKRTKRHTAVIADLSLDFIVNHKGQVQLVRFPILDITPIWLYFWRLRDWLRNSNRLKMTHIAIVSVLYGLGVSA